MKYDILIIGDRNNILEYAINCQVKLIILVGNGEISKHNFELAKEKKIKGYTKMTKEELQKVIDSTED